MTHVLRPRRMAPALGVLTFIAVIPSFAEAQPPASPGPTAAPRPPVPGWVDGTCVATEPVPDRPPDDPNASTFSGPGTWYANADRTLWAWWWGRTEAGDYKVLWVRPAGAPLTIGGRRLDAAGPVITANMPGGYPWTFQATGVNIPTPGCWQVEGSADGHTLTFVVRVPGA